MNEYITKSQAIDLAESLRPIAGNGITDAFIKGIEGVEGCRLIKNKEPVDGKTVAIKLSPQIENTLRGWISDKQGQPAVCYGPVLGTDGERMFVCKYDYSLGIWINLSNGYAELVKFWMPLPEPPKE